MTDTTSRPPDGKARATELLHQMRDAARPDGIFERLAIQRLAVAWWHFERFASLAIQNVHVPGEANRFQKNALRWETSFNRSMRELRTLQTARAIANPAAPPPPMANLQQLQHFAKRTAAPHPTVPGPTPAGREACAGPAPTTSSGPVKSTLCETNAVKPDLSGVGRNSPCPCGSGIKFKRCCGVNAPPIYTHAA